ncbi:hypothetical protein EI555_012663 [Monodon monoceros]|uniref:XK-related protein n=1 Tax=Monodon monoceros TaxID=40151 RepID=A0A4V5P7S9_MONMO|nr:hypothetical protein EI555_012663 [Monodon monoceros]
MSLLLSIAPRPCSAWTPLTSHLDPDRLPCFRLSSLNPPTDVKDNDNRLTQDENIRIDFEVTALLCCLLATVVRIAEHKLIPYVLPNGYSFLHKLWLFDSRNRDYALIYDCFTAAASLVSLAWALASYQKALRDSRDDKKPISYMAVVLQFCWHFFTIAARVITFALFASVFQLYFGIFIVLHWCVMTFWIVHCETEFCITKWEEIVFDMVVGIIYIFSWFNVKEGRTRCRLFIYYFVILVENTALSALWYLYKAPQIADAFAIPALCVVFSSFLTGVVFMLMYYAFFHPNGPRLGRSPSCACGDPAAAFTPSPEVATSALRSLSNTRSVAGDRDQKFAERDGCVPVFQVRPTALSTPSSRPPRIEESVIKIDLFRNRYPAWERHVLDRSLRKAILAFEGSPSPPRLQYKDDALIQERLEYETTL